MVANLNPGDALAPVTGADQRQAAYDQQHGVMYQHLSIPDLLYQAEPQLTDIVNFIRTMVEIRLLDGRWPDSSNQGQSPNSG